MKEKNIVPVLVIEDDPVFVALLKHYSKKMKNIELVIYHKVTLEESLKFLQENHAKIDLIILDYRVHAKITGLEILQHIRANGYTIPVIVITASGDEKVCAEMFRAGANDYLVKHEFTAEELEERIKEVFKRYEQCYNIFTTTSLLRDMALETVLNGICMMNLDGEIVYVNNFFVNILGYESKESLLNKKIQKVFSTEEVFNFEKISNEVKSKGSWIGEIEFIRKTSQKVHLQCLFSLIKEKNEYLIIGSFIDISSVKEEEKKREQLYQRITEVFALSAEWVGNVETADHIRRIAAYTRLIATKLEEYSLKYKEYEKYKEYINEKYINDISYASMLHDIGKWKTPNEILLKPSQLTDEEREIIKKHPQWGKELLSPVLKDKGSNQYLKLLESIVLYHHENWDGSGYPEGLRGEEIPLSARIVAIADTYDALTSDRCYRKAYTHEEAISIMSEEKHRFDPSLWKIFIENQEEFKKIREGIKT